MIQQSDKNLSRRQFLARSAKAGVTLAAAGAASYFLYDSQGPAAGSPEELVALPDFSLPFAPGNAMSIVKASDRTLALDKAIDLLGGIGRFIKPGDRVLIKPNVAFASPPLLNATTNPQLLAELVRLCYRANAQQVFVADNPINDPASCFRISGIGSTASHSCAKIITPRPHHFKPTTLAAGKLIRNWPLFYEPFEKIDKLIGIAPVKDHHRSGASMTMKNWYGLLGGQRNIFHQDINTIITELAMLVRPTLVILDGTEVMISNGPTGGSVADLVRKNTIIVSCDQVAADAFGATLLGLKTTDLPYLTMAQNKLSGTTNFQSLKPLYAEVNA